MSHGRSEGPGYQETELFPSAEKIGTAISLGDKLKAVWENPEVKEAFRATYRTVVNAGITVAEFVPVVGTTASWGADFGKIVDPWVRKYLGVGSDTTPDVSKAIAIGTELLEPVTLGMAPTHGIETALQIFKDLPRIKEGIVEAIGILRGETRGNTPREVFDAAKQFGVEL